MKKEKFASRVLRVVESAARKELEKNVFGGTPKCSGIWHQPKRPKKTK